MTLLLAQADWGAIVGIAAVCGTIANAIYLMLSNRRQIKREDMADMSDRLAQCEADRKELRTEVGKLKDHNFDLLSRLYDVEKRMPAMKS